MCYAGTKAALRSAAAVIATLALSGCLQPQEIAIDDAWVRLPAAAGRPGSGYFTMTGGPEAATLISVRADRALRTEMHATVRRPNGAMTMVPLAGVPVAARGEVRFAPGGRHLMFYGISPSLTPGKSTILTFTLADGRRIERKAWAVGPGDPAPE